MAGDILKITILCITLGGLSIPPSFAVNNSPWIVWIGNALGSVISAFVVIYIGDRITNQKFKNRVGKRHFGKKVVKVFDEGQDNHAIATARININKYGLRIFSLLCPIFPGVLLSTVAVYVLDLDKQTYKRWMFAGVALVSGIYVFGYWAVFVK